MPEAMLLRAGAQGWRKGARLLALLAAGLVVLEGVLRLALPPPPSLYQLHDAWLYGLRPSSHVVAHIVGRGPFEFTVNAAGLLGDELPPVKTSPHVVVYGDSMLQGWALPAQESFSRHLQRDLGARRRGLVRVLNAAVPGYGPDQVSRRLETEIDTLQPDLLVVGLFAGNDWGDLMRNKLFRLDAGGGVVSGRPRLSESYRDGFEARGLRRLALLRSIALLRGRLLRLAVIGAEGPDWCAIERALRESQREYEEFRRGDDRVTTLLSDHYDADVSLSPGSASATAKRRLMHGVVARVAEQAARRSIPLLLVLVPAACDVDGSVARQAHRRFPDYRPSNATDALAGIAAELGIRSVDLFRFTTSDHYAPDGHWSAAGSRMAAERTAEAIVSGGLLR